MLHFNDYKSILCLNGSLPPASFFDCSLPIIAADGAANSLMQLGIKPHLVIGDLDSIKPELLTQLKTLHRPDQNFCDHEKSLTYLAENNLLPAIVVGVNGGYLDHILNNINLFLTGHNVLYAPPLLGYVLQKNEEKKLNLPLETKISLIGVPSAIVDTKGLKWELHQYALSFPGKNSCFNRTINETIDIKVKNGTLLLFIEL